MIYLIQILLAPIPIIAIVAVVARLVYEGITGYKPSGVPLFLSILAPTLVIWVAAIVLAELSWSMAWMMTFYLYGPIAMVTGLMGGQYLPLPYEPLHYVAIVIACVLPSVGHSALLAWFLTRRTG